MPDFFLITNNAGTIECVSLSAASAFGYSVAELSGKPVSLILDLPAKESTLDPPMAWLHASPHPVLNAIHRDGRRFPLRITPHEIEGSGQRHYVITMQDPSTAVSEDSPFLRHKELYELATWHGRISCWEVNYRTNCLEFSPVLAKMLGLRKEQIPSTVEGWSKQFFAEDWRALELESQKLLRHEIDEINLECRMSHVDGSTIWTLVRGHAIFDDEGIPIKTLGTSIDITKQKKAELERDLFFTLSLDLLGIADLKGYFRRVNPTFCRTLGYNFDELTTRPFFDFVHPDDLDETLNVMSGLRKGEDVVAFENRYRCKDGSYRWLSWKCPAPPEGSELLYAVARDVTAGKQAQAELERAKQEAEEANRAKSEFLSRMSHELRTPLNAILGFGQLLQREPLTPRQLHQIDLIVKGGRHLLTLINEVLDITRIEVGRLDLSPESVELTDLIHEVVNLTQPLADQAAIHVTLDEASLRDRSVVADKQRLKQVLLNLVANAIKYNFERGKVEIFCKAANKRRLEIHVRDSGPGIARDKQPRLFTPFDRLGAETTPIEGSGLGLVLSKRLIESMGGKLRFVSKQGHGTTFIVELAIGKNAKALADAVPAPALPTSVDVTVSHTVLYIEDNIANVRLIEAVLAHRPGIRLLTALQGCLGIDSARADRPDLILLDVHLPDMKGSDVLQQIRHDTDLRDIPVVVISADATKYQMDSLRDAGADEYLTKPIEVDHFLNVLDRYLK